MNRYICLLTFLVTLLLSCKVKSGLKNTSDNNQINHLKSNEQVIKFVVDNFDEFKSKDEYHTFKLKPIKDLYSDERFTALINNSKPSSWIIQDFNDDNVNDILIYGYYSGAKPILILGSLNKSYTLLNLEINKNGNNFFPVVEKLNDKHYIKVYETISKLEEGHIVKTLEEYFLTIHDKSLIEYSFEKKEISIDKISYFQVCSGYCPTMMITINKSGELYLAEMSYDKEKGFYKSKVSTGEVEDITDWIQLLNIEELESHYKSDYTHTVPARLVIKYNNGKIKEIKDDGKSGTYGLRELYQRIEKVYLSSKFSLVKPITNVNEEVNLDELMY